MESNTILEMSADEIALIGRNGHANSIESGCCDVADNVPFRGVGRGCPDRSSLPCAWVKRSCEAALT